MGSSLTATPRRSKRRRQRRWEVASKKGADIYREIKKSREKLSVTGGTGDQPSADLIPRNPR